MYEASKILYAELSDRKQTKNSSDNDRKVGAHKGSLFFLGISIENAIKVFFAYKDKIQVEDGKLKVKNSFPLNKASPHDLLALAIAIELELLDEEKELLSRLSVFTIWAGKYGTPLSESDLNKAQGLLIQSEIDYQVAALFIDKLKNKSGFNHNTGWPQLNL
ncbi:hypothetical protein [Catenovulum maritimum]|nr:hypothetical protein [Catenovulum maritimum]